MNIYDCLFAIVSIVFWIWELGIATLVCISEIRKENKRGSKRMPAETAAKALGELIGVDIEKQGGIINGSESI